MILIYGVLFAIALFYILYFLIAYLKFQKSTYKEKSGKNFFQTIFDKGFMGEYQIYLLLEKEGYSYILTNVYLPSPSKKVDTTEIDILAITEKGIYVFESKNYSGWIFGDEKSRKWTQVIYNKKERFYNPIMQNNTHIKALKLVLENIPDSDFMNYVVFSQRCELKKINVENEEITLLKRPHLKSILKQNNEFREDIFTKEEVKEIYSQLSQYTNVSDKIKEKHIQEINEKIK